MSEVSSNDQETVARPAKHYVYDGYVHSEPSRHGWHKEVYLAVDVDAFLHYRSKTNATHRLHNLCDGFSEDAKQSPFTHEEWDSVDRQTVRLQKALRGLIDAVRNIEIDKASWDAHIALPLANSYRALKHEDPLTALERVKP